MSEEKTGGVVFGIQRFSVHPLSKPGRLFTASATQGNIQLLTETDPSVCT